MLLDSWSGTFSQLTSIFYLALAHRCQQSNLPLRNRAKNRQAPCRGKASWGRQSGFGVYREARVAACTTPDNYKPGDNTEQTLHNYVSFLKSIDRILFERKNILLPSQASVFTTNYDEFFEVAASNLPSIVLNDGFNRRTGASNFVYTPELFFDRVYRSGTIYQH